MRLRELIILAALVVACAIAVRLSAGEFSPDQLRGIQTDVPTVQLSKVAGQPFSEASANTRSAKDAAIYRTVSPSVVLILTKDGLGSGSLIDKTGYVITNYHVVKGYSNVGVVFKPAIEGTEPTRNDMVRGEVTKYDEVADLALVKVAQVPPDRNPLRLGNTPAPGWVVLRPFPRFGFKFLPRLRSYHQ